MSANSTATSPQGPDDGTLRFHIVSDFDEGKRVQKRILDEVERYDFSADAVFAIKLALEEALINAIKHGNRLDPDKRVKIEATVDETAARIMIHDEGAGFIRDKVPDPTLEENIEKCSGRGILLIEAYMTEAEWTDHGRRLEMVKLNAAEPPTVP
ncbi:MAG: ATP-binding protein [Planctomycetota bacterium]